MVSGVCADMAQHETNVTLLEYLYDHRQETETQTDRQIETEAREARELYNKVAVL